MKKRLLCLVLALGVCLGSVFATGEEFFPAVNAYPGYADVKETDWFYENARLCNEVGLMNGTDKGFEPEKTLTVAECAAVASRIRSALTGEAVPSGTPLVGQTRPWYQDYLDYMRSADATLTPMLAHPEESCSRMQYLLLLNAALPSGQGLLSAINSITSLPDTDNSTVLAFYNAGILTGVDEYGTFDGDKSLTRAECAAMVSRIVRPALRQSFTPQTASAKPSQPAGQERDLGTQTAMTVNGQAVSAQEFAFWAAQVAYYWDSYYYTNFNTRLVWSEETETELMGQAETQCAAYVLMEAKAQELGCDTQQLAAALTPAPGHDALSAYAQEQDYLCAKHILVNDIETANAVLDGLKVVPTLEQFDALLTVFGSDPGMASNPSGYLFSAGEMVSEFENGTRALSIGSHSAEPVQSTYGYHIIWRLDPADHPDLIAQYQEEVLNDFVDDALATAQITLNQDVIGQINLPATYENYLQLLAAQQ